MSEKLIKSANIHNFILNNIEKHPGDINKITTDYFGITRQAVNKHINQLIKEGVMIKMGKTKSATYKLTELIVWEQSYQIIPNLAEDLIWKHDIRPLLGDMPENILDIWYYGFTEMFNNAIDHSGGSEIKILIKKTAINTQAVITDNGVGIFRKIQKKLNLLDERHALFELSKGKLTTDPNHHSGEGIFFTSRMFNSYIIYSHEVAFYHQIDREEDWIIDHEQEQVSGTMIMMKLNNAATHTSKEIFDKYTCNDSYTFNKTVIPVNLAQYDNDKLISRSQAKRLLSRVELFKIVVFDFTNVDFIGQAFADEIFRVFAIQHPAIEFHVINANPTVMQMITRVKSS